MTKFGALGGTEIFKFYPIEDPILGLDRTGNNSG